MRLLPLFTILFMLACGTTNTDDMGPEGWVMIPLDHAQNFRIESRGEERRLTVLGPGGEKDTVAVYVLGGDALPRPLKRIAGVSTTHLSYLDALGGRHCVVGAAHPQRVLDEGLRAWLLEHVPDIGQAAGLDRELLIALAPDALLDYPFNTGGSSGTIHAVPRIAITEYLEEHPLGRAEWLRFFGVLVGRERESDSLYAAIKERYQELIRPGAEERPKVFFGSVYNGQWFVPPGNSYMATLIHDAGGDYLFKDRLGGENMALDLETVLDACSRITHFGALLATQQPLDALALAGEDPRLAGMQALSEGGFVGNSATADIFGKALLEPDVVLRDLRCIFAPERCGEHVPVYFTPIAQMAMPARR